MIDRQADILAAAAHLCSLMSEEDMHEMVSRSLHFGAGQQADVAAAFTDLAQAVQDYQGEPSQ